VHGSVPAPSHLYTPQGPTVPVLAASNMRVLAILVAAVFAVSIHAYMHARTVLGPSVHAGRSRLSMATTTVAATSTAAVVEAPQILSQQPTGKTLERRCTCEGDELLFVCKTDMRGVRLSGLKGRALIRNRVYPTLAQVRVITFFDGDG
jgi:hypothetical protein